MSRWWIDFTRRRTWKVGLDWLRSPVGEATSRSCHPVAGIVYRDLTIPDLNVEAEVMRLMLFR